jgi:hypothetical protein
MIAKTHAALRRAHLVVAPIVFTLALGACGDSSDNDSTPPPGVPMTPPPPATPPSPPPSPPPAAGPRNVSACLSQAIPGTSNAAAGGVPFTAVSLVLPDTLKLDFSRPAGFPNGRGFDDPVIDITLAVLLLKFPPHNAGTLVGVLNPPSDNTLLPVFPFIGLANGGQPGPGTGTTFNFRTDPISSYTRVDRMGLPAVATALIGTSLKNAYNDANPSDDVAGTFVGGPDGIVQQLTNLHNALADDLIAAGLTPCSTP